MLSAPRGNLAAILLVAVVALTAGGCGSSSDESATTSGTSTPTAAATPDGSTTGGWGAPGVGSETEETRTVSVGGVSFDVPAGWTDIDAADVAEARKDSPAMAELGDRAGLTPDQVRQLFEQVDLFLFSDDGARQGFLDNINVIALDDSDLPGMAEVRLQLLQLDADIESVDQVATDLGDAIVADYRLPVGSTTVAGRSAMLAVEGGTVTVTVSALDPELADQLRDRVLTTLAAS